MHGKNPAYRGSDADRRAWMIGMGLLLMGCLLRLLFLESLPYGLNQDEASAGYDAWALMQSGIDRHGKSWPILFISWGSGQNVLMSYLAMPWIALLGLRPLSIRIPNALAGCVTLFFMWRIARRCRGERFGLIALFLLVINPWHIMASRWGLESNLLPALLWGACLCLSYAEERPMALLGAAVFLGLAPYAYGTAFFLLPPLLIWIAIRIHQNPAWMRIKWVWISLGLFVLLVLPITLCNAINMLGGEECTVLGITFSRLTEPRQNETSIFSGEGLTAIRDHISTFLEMIHNGDDHQVYNALPYWQGGILYFFGVPLAILGAVVSVQQRKEHLREWPLMAMGCCGLLCAALIDGNINRLNMIWLPMIYFSGVGVNWLIDQLRLRCVLPLSVAAICFLYFCISYVSVFAAPGEESYFPGLGQAILAAEEQTSDTIYITEANQPYIFALFYSKPLPEEFLESVEYENEDSAMQEVTRFRGFEFEDPERADLWICPADVAAEAGKEVLGTYGAFQVCR